MNDLITRRAAIARVAYLMGGALSASTVAGVLAGCDRRVDAGAGITALNSDRRALVATLADHILPETDTPGARSAGVDEFIDAMITDYYSETDRNRFVAGLERVDERARRVFGVRFVDASAEQQLRQVEAMNRQVFGDAAPPRETLRDEAEEVQAASGAVDLDADWHPDDIGRQAFFRTLKELVLVGYYTSEVGATAELRTPPLGEWKADVPYSEIGRAWA